MKLRFSFEPQDDDEFDPRLCSVAAAVIGAGALGAGASIYGANKAASAQGHAADMATQAELSMFNQAKDLAQPFISAGQSVLPTLQKLLTPGGDMSAALADIPGFKFAQQWGQNAIQNLATSRGLGGNVLKAGADYATGAASQTYGGILNALQALAGLGSNAAAGVGGHAVTTGGQIGGNLIGAGNAAAGADIASSNALAGLTSNFSNLAILNKLTGGQILGGSSGMYGSALTPEALATLSATSPGSL